MSQTERDFEITFFENLVKGKPDYIDALVILAEAYTRNGLYSKGLEIDRRLAKLCQDDPVVHYNLACSFALLGKKKEALTSLQRAVKLGYRDFEHMKRDLDLTNLHEESYFQELTKKKK